jgi:nitroreductase
LNGYLLSVILQNNSPFQQKTDRIYLAAYAQGLGATGLTFYDDAVTEFFSPHASEKSVMFLVAIGKRARHNPS